MYLRISQKYDSCEFCVPVKELIDILLYNIIGISIYTSMSLDIFRNTSQYLIAILKQSYFMTFCLTMISIIGRLFILHKQLLSELIDLYNGLLPFQAQLPSENTASNNIHFLPLQLEKFNNSENHNLEQFISSSDLQLTNSNVSATNFIELQNAEDLGEPISYDSHDALVQNKLNTPENAKPLKSNSVYSNQGKDKNNTTKLNRVNYLISDSSISEIKSELNPVANTKKRKFENDVVSSNKSTKIKKFSSPITKPAQIQTTPTNKIDSIFKTLLGCNK